MATRSARRAFLSEVFGVVGTSALAGPVLLEAHPQSGAGGAGAASSPQTPGRPAPPAPEPERLAGSIRITKLETFLVKPRWLFLKVHTDAGIVGLGEPITEGRALTCAEAIKEIEPYLVGKDPRRVAHHWQAIYRHAFYRGGPILTSALSGIDQALWDIKGKALKVPVYELLRRADARPDSRVCARAHDRGGEAAKEPRASPRSRPAPGSRADSRTAVAAGRASSSRPRSSKRRPTTSRSCATSSDRTGDIGIDFHGAISPATAKLLIKAIEPYQPMFVEEPVNCQNVEAMADIARGTHLPIATGERIFTKWGFREILEKQAAVLLQPDLCHAGGITECRIIAGMAEAYYASIAPHNPLGPISLAAGLAACGVDSELHVSGAGEPGRGLSQATVRREGRLRRSAEGAGPRHRAGRGRR